MHCKRMIFPSIQIRPKLNRSVPEAFPFKKNVTSQFFSTHFDSSPSDSIWPWIGCGMWDVDNDNQKPNVSSYFLSVDNHSIRLFTFLHTLMEVKQIIHGNVWCKKLQNNLGSDDFHSFCNLAPFFIGLTHRWRKKTGVWCELYQQMYEFVRHSCYILQK